MIKRKRTCDRRVAGDALTTGSRWILSVEMHDVQKPKNDDVRLERSALASCDETLSDRTCFGRETTNRTIPPSHCASRFSNEIVSFSSSSNGIEKETRCASERGSPSSEKDALVRWLADARFVWQDAPLFPSFLFFCDGRVLLSHSLRSPSAPPAGIETPRQTHPKRDQTHNVSCSRGGTKAFLPHRRRGRIRPLPRRRSIVSKTRYEARPSANGHGSGPRRGDPPRPTPGFRSGPTILSDRMSFGTDPVEDRWDPFPFSPPPPHGLVRVLLRGSGFVCLCETRRDRETRPRDPLKREIPSPQSHRCEFPTHASLNGGARALRSDLFRETSLSRGARRGRDRWCVRKGSSVTRRIWVWSGTMRKVFFFSNQMEWDRTEGFESYSSAFVLVLFGMDVEF